METSAVTNDNMGVSTVKLGCETCLVPHLIRKRSNASEYVGPPAIRLMSLDCSDAVKTVQTKNFTWHMIRQINTAEQNVCGWTGFNITTRDKISINQDTVGYLPTINAPATAMSTVNEILPQALKTA